MSKTIFFTSASYAYLDRVNILVETLKQHTENCTFALILVDEEPENFSYDFNNSLIDQVVYIKDLLPNDFEAFIFRHDIVELSTAVKGEALCHFLNKGFDKAIYLDPDIAVFSSLQFIDDLLDTHDIILTPHILEEENTEKAIVDNEFGALKYGIFNLGFFAVANTKEGLRFASWWRDRLLKYCYDDIDSGLFTDQKWCNHVPVFFPSLHILRDQGCNVASWNLSNRKLQMHKDGTLTAGQDILKFFHFTKVTTVGETMLLRYSNNNYIVLELLEWYKHKLSGYKLDNLPNKWWAYSKYSDGELIPKQHRVKYRTNVPLMKDYKHPQDVDSGFRNKLIGSNH